MVAVQLRAAQADFGGGLRLWGSVLLEALLSALQAPLRMLAHSAFVLGALTGLRLSWKSPAREAQAVTWRDAGSRVGVLALPALALALALPALRGQSAQNAWLPTPARRWSAAGAGPPGRRGRALGSRPLLDWPRCGGCAVRSIGPCGPA